MVSCMSLSVFPWLMTRVRLDFVTIKTKIWLVAKSLCCSREQEDLKTFIFDFWFGSWTLTWIVTTPCNWVYQFKVNYFIFLITMYYSPGYSTLIFLFCSSSRWYCPCSGELQSKQLSKEQVLRDLLLVNVSLHHSWEYHIVCYYLIIIASERRNLVSSNTTDN